jgi:hypothetical protein
MAAEPKTQQFLLSTATVMLGPMAEVFNLQPTQHSIGLVKNFRAMLETGVTELKHGVQNIVIASVVTEANMKASCEVYEYTARNLAYGAGLNPSGAVWEPGVIEKHDLAQIFDDGDTTIVLETGAGANFTAGDWVVLQFGEDQVHIAKIASISTDTLTVTGYACPTGVAFPVVGTTVYRVAEIEVGPRDSSIFFGMKVVGILPNDSDPVTLVFPKVRITRGFELAFQTQDFGNMPMEFAAYPLVSTDTHYAKFGKNVMCKTLKAQAA